MASKSKLDDMVTTIQSVVGKLQTILRFTQDHPEQSSSSLQRASLGSLREAQELQTLFFQSNGCELTFRNLIMIDDSNSKA